MNELRSGRGEPPGRAPAVEDIHVRNYDTERGHSVWVSVVDGGDQVFEERYHLGPGDTRSERGLLPGGEYAVEVGLDGLRRQVARCRVGDEPSETIRVETGDGALSIAEGLY